MTPNDLRDELYSLVMGAVECRQDADMATDDILALVADALTSDAALEAQVSRLREAFKSRAAEYDATVKAEYSFALGIDELADMHGLQPGDLDPVKGGDDDQ